LEAFSRALTAEELSAALELAVISVIVLPLLPNRGYGPWQVLNPFDIWLVVVLVSTLSFAGFVAVRVWGERQGLAIAAGAGALVSSTAVTLAMATRSREQKNLAGATAAAAVVASVVMCIRVVVLTGSIGPGILPRLLPVVGAMALEGIVAAWWLAKKAAVTDSGASGAEIHNPFSLIAALTFGAVYALVLLLVQGAQTYLGARGIYLAATLASIADVDAVSIACARLGTVEAAWRAPAAAVTVAVVTSTLVKLLIALVAGGGSFKTYVAAALGIMAAVGAAVGMLVFLRF
jgi:uncharacterized membrane protein (DUF4010 family)